jgi:hypothetical protein
VRRGESNRAKRASERSELSEQAGDGGIDSENWENISRR